MAEKFGPAGEKDITRSIVGEFAAQFAEYVESDCLIIGDGPSGLMAGKNLAKAGKKVLIVEWTPRMGPTFGAMLLSGEAAAEIALKSL